MITVKYIFCINRETTYFQNFISTSVNINWDNLYIFLTGFSPTSFLVIWRLFFRFRIDNTDHIIDVNKGNVQFEYDQVNIICPVYMPGTYDEDAEKYIIYNVSKEEYDTCRITNPNPRIIAICDKPYKLMYFTITFRPFTPQPGGLEFLPGKDYYFICKFLTRLFNLWIIWKFNLRCVIGNTFRPYFRYIFKCFKVVEFILIFKSTHDFMLVTFNERLTYLQDFLIYTKHDAILWMENSCGLNENHSRWRVIYFIVLSSNGITNA